MGPAGDIPTRYPLLIPPYEHAEIMGGYLR